MKLDSENDRSTHPAPRRIRLLLVEDDRRLRETLARIFRASPEIEVVGTYADAESATGALSAVQPDVVLMDIQLPGMTGIECLRRIKAQLPHIRVAMLTVFDDSDTLFRSLMAGADGYLVKGSPSGELIDAVREIAAGGAPMSPQIARRTVEYFHLSQTGGPGRGAATPGDDAPPLSTQEHQILSMMADGLRSKEVAQALDISWETVRKHLVNIYRKLHVHSQAEALSRFRQMIQPP